MKTALKNKIELFLKSLEIDNLEIMDYIDIDNIDMDSPFDSIYDMIEDNGGFDVEIIYYFNAMEYLSKNGVGCRPYFTPIHIQPYMVEMFGYKEEDFPNTAAAGRSCIALPFFNDLADNEIEFVAAILEKAITENKIL